MRLPELVRRPEATPFRRQCLVGIDGDVPAYWRDRLASGQRLTGPALVCEQVATTWLAPGWSLRVDPVGHLLLERSGG
jgi:N-methylhydantoinase A